MTNAEAKVKATHPKAVAVPGAADPGRPRWQIYPGDLGDGPPIASGSTPEDAWISAARKLDPEDRTPLPTQAGLFPEE